MDKTIKLSANSLSFIALTNEFCHDIEGAVNCNRDEFVAQMLKVLPRIYISASDLDRDILYSDYDIEPYLEEETYNRVKDVIAGLMSDEDVYLEVFVEDMKYSDSPIATSVSENLADLYQEFFDFISNVKDATTEVQQEMMGICKSNFRNYWGQTLCNVLRALNTIFYNPGKQEENY